MECRKFEITLVSAENLPNIRSLGLMKVYAEVSINGESQTTKYTNVDMEGETSPRWNFAVEYTISESAVEQPGVNLVVKLFCKRTMGDKLVGEVKIPVKSLFDMGITAEKNLSYTVSGTRDGKLNISYSFGEKIVVPKPSGWKTALNIGVVVLARGTWFLLTGDTGDWS